jgi:hypothetical protein
VEKPVTATGHTMKLAALVAVAFMVLDSVWLDC